MSWVTFDKEKRLRAQGVLDDATSAIFKWAYGPIEKGVESRVIYVAAVSLLRSVGHVLHKVDCRSFPEIRLEVDQRFRRWKRGEGKDLIFTEFIEKERNLVLKEYSPNWDPRNEVELKFRPIPIGKQRSDKSRLLTEAIASRLEGRSIRAILMPEGPFAGWGFDELLHEAAGWWSRELTEIEKHLEDQIQ